MTRNEYDGAGNLTASINALGQRTSNAYDGAGNLTSTADARGNVTATFAYDGTGNLTSTTDAAGFTRSFAYDANGNQTGTSYEWVSSAGVPPVLVQTQTIYNDSGQVIRTVDPDGNQTTTVYNEIGKPAETTDKLGNVTRYTYDARGNLIQTEYPDSTVTRTVYDENGRAVVTSDRQLAANNANHANGTRTIYDSVGRVIRTERLANVVIGIGMDSSGQPTTSLSSFASVISSASSSYDPASRVIVSTGPDGQVTRYEYDAAGRRTAITDALGNRTEFTYDAAGRQILLRDALLREVRYEYDALGRRTRTIFPDGTFTATAYNDLGQRVSETDQANLASTFEYDILGRLTAVLKPAVPDPEAGNVLTQPRYEYEYDTYGRLQVIRDAKGRETKFAYDSLGRQLTRTLPLGQTESQTYNALGQLAARTDFKGQVTEFVYDTLGRAQTKHLKVNSSSAPAESITFAYDSLGRQDQITETRGVSDFAYDQDGRLTQISSPEGTIHYEYDAATGRKTRTFTANSDTQYTYDQLGRLKTVEVLKRNGVVLATPEFTTYAYTAVGSRDSVEMPNGAATLYQYDNLNRLTKLTNVNAADEILSEYSYTLHPTGRRTRVVEAQLEADNTYSETTVTYSYDALYRLTQEASADNVGATSSRDFTSTYAYDLVGNRLSKSSESVVSGLVSSVSYASNANDQLLSETSVGSVSSVVNYSYDANGSQISKVVASAVPAENASYAFGYNLENRLASATISRTENGSAVSITSSYFYNQSGIRVRADTATSINGGAASNRTKLFLTDPNNHTGYAQVLEEISVFGAVQTVERSYTIGDDVLSQTDTVNNQPSTDHLLYDGHGSTRLLTSSTGTIASRFAYDAYGQTLGQTFGALNSPLSALLYSGEQFDSDLGNYYLRARYYDPSNGRFNQLDPFAGNSFDPQSLHKYAYAHEDPVNGVDPSGHFTLVELVFVVAAGLLITAILLSRPVRGIRAGLAVSLNSVLYAPGMTGHPGYAAATQLLADARAQLGLLQTPAATAYYDDYFAAGSAESHHLFFVQTPTVFYGAVPLFKRNQLYLSYEWSTDQFTPLQRALIMLHELRHSIDGAGETVAYRAMYVAETRYRKAANGVAVLPIPPAEPPNVVFNEQTYLNPGWSEYLSQTDRMNIVLEMNTTGHIADDTWPQ